MWDNKMQLQYFKEVLLFFKEVQWLYNMPVTKILFPECLDRFPEDWLKILKNLSTSELNNFVVEASKHSHWPTSLIKFVENCCKFNKLPKVTRFLSPINLPRAFMKKLSIKKQHEIFYLAKIVHEQCLSQQISLIVDLGAGLGYICQLLNHLFGYKVLGLESNVQNVMTAKLRQTTLFPDSLKSVKYICNTININSSKNLESIIQQEFGEAENTCLIGLHACGDLSVFMSKIYTEIKMAQLLILVSCCYHKLTLLEAKNKNQENIDNEYFNHFPLSTSLKHIIAIENIDIGKFIRRPFMRLACQETSDRWLLMLEEAHNKHSFYVLARAVLELYSAKNGLYLKKLVRKGTRKSQCSSFENYLEDCRHRYVYEKNITVNGKLEAYTIPWDDKITADLETLWKNYLEKLKDVELYTALQLLLQRAAESLVLIDRLCFLEEENSETDIISIMDRSLSPRSYAVISKKRK